jgi:ketosteroid isomerase-like protein
MALKLTILASVATLSAVIAVRAAPLVESSRAAVVRAKFAAFNRHDAQSIEQLFAADARLRSPDYPALVGNRPIGDTYRRLFAAIPDARDEVTVLEVGPERVYAQFTLSGHWGGDPDKPITVRIISVYRVKSGKIFEDDSYYDRKP